MSRDPYEVLGLSRNASQEEIKQRYRELAKKYHPDKYQNNPLADLAEEKLREVNEAYDTLTRGMAGSNSYGSGQGGYKDSIYIEIRKALDSGNINRAQELLNSVTNRQGEWYFLNGMLSYKKGWFDDAITNIQMAVSLDPNNLEYRSALNQIVGMGGFKSRAGSRGYGSGDSDCCRMAACYCCFDALCDCI